MVTMANNLTKTTLLVAALLAAALSAACASRQYTYGFETRDLASSGKASIANGGISLTTDNGFSEAAFLGSPVYVRQVHLATAMSGPSDASYEGALSICIKKLLVWKQSQSPSPPGVRCGAGVRDLTVDIKSGPQQPTAAKGDCRSNDCADATDVSKRVFELHIPYKDTRVWIAITNGDH
jgi:hypothetical protein